MKKVKDIMTRNVKSCRSDTSLAETAGVMWEQDCGVLPVVDENGKVIGVVTDRDMCMSLAMKDRTASNILVREVLSANLYSCTPDDDIKTALKTMRSQRVRRLPVISDDGKLQGILSLNDIVLKAEEGRDKGISYEDVMNTFREICEHPTSRAATAI
jgi:CBS domain-containing protein